MTSATSSIDASASLETRIGTQWLLYAGVVALLVGAGCFIKLAIDDRWMTPAAQVFVGAAAGSILVAAGCRVERAGYARYGEVVAGTGLAVLYVSFYAAFTLYHLLSWPVASACMLATTASGVVLADTHRSQSLALFAIGGAFATPFLLPSLTDPRIALFTYDTILVGATVHFARRRSWPLLNLVSYGATVVTTTAWASQFYAPDAFLTTEIYLSVLCAMFLGIARQSRGTADPLGLVVRGVLLTAPVAYYVASLSILDSHTVLFLCFLGALIAAGALLTRGASSSRVFLLIWIAVQEPLFAWIALHRGPDWSGIGLVAVGAIYVMTLLRHLDAIARRAGRIGNVDRALLLLNGAAAAGATYLLLEAVRPGLTASSMAAWSLWHLGLALALARRQPHRQLASHFAALSATLLSVAIALQFHGLAIVVGWAVEGAVIVWLALRERNEWLRGGGAVLFALAAAQLIAEQLSRAGVDQHPLLNARTAASVFVIFLTYALAWLHRRLAGAQNRAGEIATCLVLANVLTLTWLSGEITAFAEMPLSAARQLSLSLTWVAYATALALLGMWRGYAPIRYLAIAVFAFAIAKVFIVDLADLDQMYRVASAVGLGVLLLTTSFFYYRSRPNALRV